VSDPEPSAGQILAIPPEPPIGARVEVVSGPSQGLQVSRDSRGWGQVETSSVRINWLPLLQLAGPGGLRGLSVHQVVVHWDHAGGDVVFRECSCGHVWTHDQDECPEGD
jgi:hypothetical protein